MIDKNDTQKRYEQWYKENAERVLGQSELWKTIQKHKELDKKEEEEKRKEIMNMNRDEVVKRYLKLSGVLRNQYNQIVGVYKRLSADQISGIMREVHGERISPEAILKEKKRLIEAKEIFSDEEYREMRPTIKIMNEIRKEGARATSIRRSKEEAKENDLELRKRHLYEIDKEEKEREREREELSRKAGRIRELLDKQERGLCLTDSEETELEKYEENQNEEDS